MDIVNRVSASLGLAVAAGFLMCACRTQTPPGDGIARQPAAAPASQRLLRAAGTVRAVRSSTLRVPQLTQTATRSPQLTLTRLIPNGTAVKAGDILFEFDGTNRIDELRDAVAKQSELEHQLAEKQAQVESDGAKRVVAIREAEVELGKAELQLRKGPVLAELDRLKNEVTAESARARLTSLNEAHSSWLKAESAAVKVLDLKCSRQKLVVARLKSNLDKLLVRAPHAGMVALENVWRNSSMGPPQVGDQLWPNQGVVRVFDPSEMIVEAQVNEPDVGLLGPVAGATVYLDAYPDAVLHARLDRWSPVATSALDSPVRSFDARFVITEHDARLLPDLSASLEIEVRR